MSNKHKGEKIPCHFFSSCNSFFSLVYQLCMYRIYLKISHLFKYFLLTFRFGLSNGERKEKNVFKLLYYYYDRAHHTAKARKTHSHTLENKNDSVFHSLNTLLSRLSFLLLCFFHSHRFFPSSL